MRKRILTERILLVTIGITIGILAAAYFFNNSINSQTAPSAIPARWKIYDNSNFSLNLPSSWVEQQAKDAMYYSSGKPGRTELSIVPVLNKSKQDLTTEVNGLFADPPVIRNLTFGSASGIEYYGCAGVEGCINKYIIIASTQGKLYEIDFTPYPDQEDNLYQNMITSLKFK